MAGLIFLLFLGAYIFVLLYLNAKARPGQGVPERLKPLKYAVNSVGLIFLALFLMVVGVLLLVVIYCSLTDCPLIE
jgi:type III secretory pathway component EscU